MEMKGQ